jgi:hypothetical protein
VLEYKSISCHGFAYKGKPQGEFTGSDRTFLGSQQDDVILRRILRFNARSCGILTLPPHPVNLRVWTSEESKLQQEGMLSNCERRFRRAVRNRQNLKLVFVSKETIDLVIKSEGNYLGNAD